MPAAWLYFMRVERVSSEHSGHTYNALQTSKADDNLKKDLKSLLTLQDNLQIMLREDCLATSRKWQSSNMPAVSQDYGNYFKDQVIQDDKLPECFPGVLEMLLTAQQWPVSSSSSTEGDQGMADSVEAKVLFDMLKLYAVFPSKETSPEVSLWFEDRFIPFSMPISS
jgi:hypothetical protein